ncbi:MAG: hypothetical protein IVW56_02430 [Candidatus Binataceae bacterium]|nr:hypothetical protein [Candidatus Binataceae bacterium]
MPALAILSYWKPIVIVALIAAGLIYRGVLVHQRDAARAQIVELTQQTGALEADNSAMRAAAVQQNAAIAALQSQMAAANAAAKSRTAEFAARGAQAMQGELAHATQLDHAAVPAGCAAAIRWGNAQGPELGRW